jgi:hypothetical protein
VCLAPTRTAQSDSYTAAAEVLLPYARAEAKDRLTCALAVLGRISSAQQETGRLHGVVGRVRCYAITTITMADSGPQSTHVTLEASGWDKRGRGARAANRNVLKAVQRIDDPHFVRSRRRLDAIKIAAFILGLCLFVAAFAALLVVTWNDPSLGPGPP